MSHPAPRLEDAVMTRRELLVPLGHGHGGAGAGRPAGGCRAAWRVGPRGDADGDAAAAGSRASIAAQARCLPKAPPLRARAKRVIHLFMNGGPSHVDTFDPKPMLDRHNGKPVPTNLPTERKTGAAMGSPFKFQKYGQSGIEVSELFAHTAGMIDDICVIRSMHADVPNHEPSLMLMNCGEARQARPVRRLVGALRPGHREPEPARLHRDVPRRLSDRRVAELAVGVPARDLPGHLHRQQAHRDREADRAHPQPTASARSAQRAAARPARRAQPAAPGPTRPDEPELEARIQSFELAYRMQSEAAEAFDISQEPADDPRACTGPACTPGSS